MGIDNVYGLGSLRPGVCTSTSRPASPFDGQVIYETDTNRVLVWDNSAWVMIADTDSPPGLQLIKTQTIGTAVSSVTVSDAFSADYDDYLITMSGGVASTANSVRLTLGSANTGYYQGGLGQTFAGANSSAEAANAAFFSVGNGTTAKLYAKVFLSSPFLADETNMEATQLSTSTTGFATPVAGFLNTTTSYTSFTFTASTGTWSGGTIRVYGYRNS